MLQTGRRILRHRGLLAILTSRELKARYRGTVLGFVWSLVNPLLLLGVYTLVFGYIFNPRWQATDPYALFLVTGLFPWIWVSGSLLEGTTSLSANAGLIRKAVFPTELLPMVSVLSNLIHFSLAIPILVAALVVGRALGYPVGGWNALLLPLVMAVQLPLLAGMSLGLAALNVHFKDVRDILANLLTLLFFLSPIIYSLEAIPSRLQWVVRLNPFTPFTLAYQSVLFDGRFPDATLWLQMIVVGLVGWSLGAWLFERLSGTLVEAV